VSHSHESGHRGERALWLRFSSPGRAGQSQTISSRSPTTFIVYTSILLESSWFAQHMMLTLRATLYFTQRCEVAINVGTEDTVQTRESSRRTSRAWTAPYFEGGGVYTGGADDDGGGW